MLPPRLEDENVKQIYSHIAVHFSGTRYKRWPVVARFLDDQPEDALGVDLGCGNGKNMTSHMIGFDVCLDLLSISAERRHEVFAADTTLVPLRPAAFDFAISIAVIHHLSTASGRLAAISQMQRLLKPGAAFLIFAWAFEENASLQRRGIQLLDATGQDVLVPWTGTDGMTRWRYYHLFRQNELDELVLSTESMVIDESGYDRDNWFVQGHRLSS